MHSSEIYSSLICLRFSTVCKGTCVTLLASLIVWALLSYITWLQSFLYLRVRLPSSAAAKSFFNVLGDLSLANTSQRHRWNTAATEALGPVFYIRALWMQAVAIADPFLCREVLQNEDLDKKPNTGYWVVTKMMSAHGEPNLVSSESDRYWRSVRKTVAVAFSSAAMKNNFDQISTAGAEIVEVLSKHGSDKSIDMFRGLLCVSVDVISKFGFNQSFGAVRSFGGGDGRHDFLDSLLLATKEAQEFLKKPYRQLLWFTSKVKQSYQTFRDFQSFMEKLVSDMRQAGPPSDADNSVSAQLLRCMDPNTGQPLSDKQLVPMASMVFWAGYDTSAVTMTWAMYLIARHPEVEAKLVAELQKHGLLATPENPKPAPPTFKQLMQLEYLSNVIQETQRLYPAVAFGTSRCCPEKDIYLDHGRLRIPKGTILWVLTHSLQNSSSIWEHPERFDPDRWDLPGADSAVPIPGKAQPLIGSMERHGSKTLDHPANIAAESLPGNYEAPQLRLSRISAMAKSGELGDKLAKFNEDQTGDPKAPPPKRWMPFMDGRRSCVGQPLAKVAMLSTLTQIYANFSMKLAGSMPNPVDMQRQETLALAVLHPGTGMHMHAHPRAQPVS